MNVEFKQIIFKLAKLSCRDQSWVLKKLTLQQRAQFNALKGKALLQDASKFRRLKELPQAAPKPSLPEACQTLCLYEPFYIAIILEQGQFPWEQRFLKTCIQQEEIKRQATEVAHLKLATKRYVFEQWKNTLSFNDQLEMNYGKSL